MDWTTVVTSLLPATVREINANPKVIRMNELHRAKRVAGSGNYAKPVNSMAYDTLYRLRKKGVVVRGNDGIYRKVE